MNTKHRGIEAELAVAHALAKAGLSVSFPFGENCPYDLIVEKDGKLFRIQIRSASWKNDVLSLSLRQVSKNYHRTLDLRRIDAFIVWDGQAPYTIPVSALSGHVASFQIRRSPAKHGQKSGCHDAADFIGFRLGV